MLAELDKGEQDKEMRTFLLLIMYASFPTIDTTLERTYFKPFRLSTHTLTNRNLSSLCLRGFQVFGQRVSCTQAINMKAYYFSELQSATGRTPG